MKTVNDDLLILFKNNIGKKLCEEWYKNRHATAYDERNRIANMAAKIILEDIRSKDFDVKN